MARELLQQAIDIAQLLCNKVIWVLSIVLGTFLTAIGYPKQVLVFILTLIIIDLITKQYSIIVRKYKCFDLKIYFRAWMDRHLTSRQLKNGIGVKAMLYSPILYIAHQASITKEVIYGGVIANVLYTMLILVEVASIFENFIECGHTEFVPFLRFIKKKQDQLTDNE